MAKVLWVVLAVAVVCFVSCSKEGAQGPAGPQGQQGGTGGTGATGQQGAPGIPRKVFTGKYAPYFTGLNGNTVYRWYSNITLPWRPANGGVTANSGGFWLNLVGEQECVLDSVAVNGTQVTVSGLIWAYYGPYNATVYFNVTAYDTLNTVFYTDKAPPTSGWTNVSPTNFVTRANSNLP
jgi:hypothetical protein